MKILKHGDLKERKFKCQDCGCEFVANYNEYIYSSFTSGMIIVCCPECEHDNIVYESNAPLYSPKKHIPIPKMNTNKKKVLSELSKEHLLYLIEQFYNSYYLIGETCVEASKLHINSDEALDQIRGYMYNMPSFQDATAFGAYIDMEMGKISVDEYRKVLGLE